MAFRSTTRWAVVALKIMLAVEKRLYTEFKKFALKFKLLMAFSNKQRG